MSRSHTVEDFLDLSAELTGFEPIDLEGTGLTNSFYDVVRSIVGGRIFGRLLLTWHDIHANPDADREHEIRTQILMNPMLGPLARNVIALWYTGNWNQMPLAWRQEYGASASDQTHVVSAEAFQEGLVWAAIDAHPPTVRSPGFGTWAKPISGATPIEKLSDESASQND